MHPSYEHDVVPHSTLDNGKPQTREGEDALMDISHISDMTETG